MADLIRAFDWNTTTLGPISSWSSELVMAVNMMLASNVIATLFWGPEQYMIYNDLYRPHLGAKHPALGQTLRSAWSEVYDLVEPIFCKPFQTGVSVLAEEMPMQVLMNGDLVEKIYTLDVVPVRGETPEGSKVLGLYQTATDHTEAVQTQRKLQTTETERNDFSNDRLRFFTLAESSPDFIGMCDLEGNPFYGNPAARALVGIDSAEEFNAMSLLDFFIPEERKSIVEDFIPQVIAAGHGRKEVCFYNRKTGEAIPMNYAVFLLKDDDGQTTGFGTVSRDLRFEKASAAALIQSEKLAAVGRLASSIAHEINNPLEAVTNLIYLARQVAVKPEVHEWLGKADAELRRVSAIASQTLRFHRQSSFPKAISCADLFTTTLDLYEARLDNSGIRVEKRKRANEPVVCFEGDIRQVLSNLVTNAIDAMPRGGRLIIRSREGTDWCTGRKGLYLTVADTGTGMNAETRRKAFEAFYTTKGIGGTGLGLWISADIMARHQGRLLLRSSDNPRHHGTVMSLFLPV